MIAFVEGRLCQTGDGFAVIDTGGIGFRVFTSASDIASLPPAGETVKMHTTLIVREDDMSLYGFSSPQELTLFGMLIQVSGVGPKAALSILSTLSPDELVSAVAAADAKTISRAPGIGAKTAGRLILELKDKLAAWQTQFLLSAADSGQAAAAGSQDTGQGSAGEAVLALEALGYSHAEAFKAVSSIEEDTGGMDTGRILKLALKYLI